MAAIFAPGVQWLAGLTWFGGCMALASHRYKQPYERFVAAQALAVVSGAAAIGVGYVYGVPSLQEIGGTFLAAWALERFIELPWKRTNYAWMCLSLAALLFVGAQFMERHPAYFLGVGGVEALEAAL